MEYMVMKLTTLMDNLNKLKHWLDELNKKWLKNKNKMLYFWNKLNFSPLHCMIEWIYLEQHKEAAGGDLFYANYKCKALISAFCILEIVWHQ